MIRKTLIAGCNPRETLIKNSSQSSTEQSLSETRNKSVDYQASFAIFTNGTFRVFTAAMYHSRDANVYIQTDNPNIIHVTG